MDDWSFDELADEILSDPDARAVAAENTIRRTIAVVFGAARQARGLSIRQMAEHIGTSPSQVQRLLHVEVGGSLTLRTLIRAAEALDLELALHARPKSSCAGRLLHFGRVAGNWSSSSPGGFRISVPPASGGAESRLAGANSSAVVNRWFQSSLAANEVLP